MLLTLCLCIVYFKWKPVENTVLEELLRVMFYFVQDYEIENKQLRETLEEYNSEFAEVKNQGLQWNWMHPVYNFTIHFKPCRLTEEHKKSFFPHFKSRFLLYVFHIIAELLLTCVLLLGFDNANDNYWKWYSVFLVFFFFARSHNKQAEGKT